MRFKTTIILVVLLVGIVLLIRYSGDEPAETERADEPLLPGVLFGTVDRIELTMSFDRKAVLERGEFGSWNIVEPYRDAVRKEVVEQIISVLAQNLREEAAPLLEGVDLKTKGLDPPAGSIKVRDARGEHLIDIGIRDPLQAQVFVVVDGVNKLFRTGSNVLNVLERMNPSDLRDKRLFRIDPNIVDQIVVEGPGKVVIHAERKFGQWKIVKPIEDEADSGRVQNLVSRLAALEIVSVFALHAGEEAKRECGFGPQAGGFGQGAGGFGPQAGGAGVLRVVLKSGGASKCVVFVLGTPGPAGSYFCMREGENDILTTDRSSFGRIPFELNLYRSKVLIPRVREDVTEVSVKKGEEIWLVLSKDKGRFFSIKEPFEAPADNVLDGTTTTVSDYLGKIFSIRANDFVAEEAENPAQYGLNEPLWSVGIEWLRGNRPRSFAVAFSLKEEDRAENDEGGQALRPGTFLYAARSDKPGFVYSVKAEEIAFLETDPLLLRDKRFFYQDLLYIQRALFTLGDKSFAIVRSVPGKYFEDDPNSRFQEFLNLLKDERVVRYELGPSVTEAPGFDTVVGSIRFIVAEPGQKPREIVVEFGEEGPDGVRARSSDLDRGVFVLKKELLGKYEQLFQGL